MLPEFGDQGLVLFWGTEKHKESLVPGCVGSDTSKVQEAISALLNRDELLLKGQAQIQMQLLEKDVRKQEAIQQSKRN